VEVEHRKRYANDRNEAGAEHGAMIETLERKIVLRGPLSDEQRDDLLRIANRCPVHRTLQHLPAVTDTIEVVA
jgi:putative redox protein